MVIMKTMMQSMDRVLPMSAEGACSEEVPPPLIKPGGGLIVYGTACSETLSGGDRADVIFGYAGHDVLLGLAGNDVLLGATENDDLLGGDGNNVLVGGVGHDRLLGEDGDDDLIGGDGDDLLIGGGGDDAMRGDQGADTYVWRCSDGTTGVHSVDHIEDFELEVDRLDVRGFFAGNLTRPGLSLSVDHEGNTQLYLLRTLLDDDGHEQQFEQTIILSSLDLTQGGVLSPSQALEQLLEQQVLVM